MTVMAETTFEVSYDGDALRDGRMPVRDLAPALLALGQLFTEASQLLYPDNDPVSLEIEATQEGSFLVDLILHAAGAGWDQVSHLSGGEGLTALVIFKEFVVGDSVDMSLFGLVKELRGRRVVEEVPGTEPGEVALRVEDGSELVVKAEVAGLNKDPQIRKKVREVVEPLRREGIDELEFRSDAKPTVRLNKDDVPAFEVPEIEDAEVLSEQEIDVFLDVLTAELEQGSTRKWRFGGIGGSFWAPIEDAGFMEEFFHRKQMLGVGDRLHAKVKIIQKRDPATNKIRVERQVMQVHEVIEAPEQLSLQERAAEMQRRFDKGDDEGPPPALPSGS
jgi:hypothetical protein